MKPCHIISFLFSTVTLQLTFFINLLLVNRKGRRYSYWNIVLFFHTQNNVWALLSQLLAFWTCMNQAENLCIKIWFLGESKGCFEKWIYYSTVCNISLSPLFLLEIRVIITMIKIESNPCYQKICETYEQEWEKKIKFFWILNIGIWLYQSHLRSFV